MKKIICLLYVLLAFNAMAGGLSTCGSFKVTQEIRYFSKEATEVYLVWGVNNWNIPGEAYRPAGSFVKEGLLYTPMTKKSSGFIAELKLPSNTQVDYVFWISKGPVGKATDIWDVNVPPAKDYHSFVTQNNITLISSKIKVRPKEMISI